MNKEELKSEYERWLECYDRCDDDDIFGKFMISGKMKKLQREYLKLKEET